MLVSEPVRLVKVNCQELTTYEWSYLGDATEGQQLDAEVFNECLPSKAELVKTVWLDLETKNRDAERTW